MNIKKQTWLLLAGLIAVSTIIPLTACGNNGTSDIKNDSEANMESSFVAVEAEPLNQDETPQIIEIEKPEEEPEVSEEPVESEESTEEAETSEEVKEDPEPSSDVEESYVIEEEPTVSEPDKSEQSTNTTQQNTTVAYAETEQSNPSVQSGTEISIPVYTYTDTSETMYTTAALNIRSGPSVNFDRIGTYTNGAEVSVTGVCNETGWSRVDYNGTVGYCSTDYLTDTEPVREDTAESETVSSTAGNTVAPNTTSNETTNTSNGAFPLYNYGWLNGQYLGRLRIPSLGINVAIYNSNSQSVVDAYDSAAFFAKGDTASQTLLCADHGSQAFSTLFNCNAGTTLYIDGVDGKTYTYICDWVDHNGYNNGQRLYFADGSVASNSNGNLICYVCNPGSTGESITMCHFHPV